jgi:hypothetical protein
MELFCEAAITVMVLLGVLNIYQNKSERDDVNGQLIWAGLFVGLLYFGGLYE